METAVEITQNMSTDIKGMNVNGNLPGETEVAVESNMEEKSQAQTIEKKPVKKPKEGKRNKEEEKRIKLLLRAFDGMESAEAKVEALAKKYVQLAAEHKAVEYRKDELESRNEKITKERDALQSDYNKATLAKSKLESLCRELQRHSKLVKEECQIRTQEEETKRKELSDRFQTTINDISQQMQDNFKRNEQLKLENEELATKLKGLVDQYESREEHVDKVFKHKQLELQLAEAKMAQQNLVFNEMKEKTLVEKQELLQDSLDYRKRYELMVKQEKELRAQVAMYQEKFEEFQSTLSKSNEVFGTFKKETDKMSKTIKKLEKDNRTWKTRWENTNRSMLDMLEERTNMERERTALKARNEKLENLCRAMQKTRLAPNKQATDELPKTEDPWTAQEPQKATQGAPTPPMESTASHRETEDTENRAAAPIEEATDSSTGATDNILEVTDHTPEAASSKTEDEDTENRAAVPENRSETQTEEAIYIKTGATDMTSDATDDTSEAASSKSEDEDTENRGTVPENGSETPMDEATDSSTEAADKISEATDHIPEAAALKTEASDSEVEASAQSGDTANSDGAEAGVQPQTKAVTSQPEATPSSGSSEESHDTDTTETTPLAADSEITEAEQSTGNDCGTDNTQTDAS